MIRNLCVTIPISLVCASIGAFYSGIDDFIGLLGGICSCICSFFFPAFIYVKFNDLPKYHWRNVTTVGICSVLCIIGLISGGASLKDLIKKF